jgi:hypothetical protein
MTERTFHHTRAALEAAMVRIERNIAKPCNHHVADARAVKQLIMRAFSELNELESAE